METKKGKGYIVTHTHWDREWRYPLWENRMLLVRMIDELLDILDDDPDYQSFLLDGQSVVIEDYLEVRPKNKERIVKYVKSGRISIGPWYTLPDLYPIDGECLVRNLLKGIRYSDSLGGHLNIAYESFGWGQTAQFPQIYKGFGLDTVIVAKNVSKERAPQSEFIWEGPDMTRILATRLGHHGRANFYMNTFLKIMNGIDYNSEQYKFNWENAGLVYHLADENGYINDYLRIQDTASIHEEFIKESFQIAWEAAEETLVKDHRILMNGSDSTSAQPSLTTIVKKARETFEDKDFVLSTLGEYVDKLKESLDFSALKIVKGELRDGPANCCSANALATRPFIKKLNKKVQNSLLKVAEPLSVSGSMMGIDYDSDFLNIAIKYLLLSHPHDSINGVTQEKTADDVIYMLNQALEISEVVSNKACCNIIKNIDTSGFDSKDILLVATNSAPFARKEIIKVYLDTPAEFKIWDFEIEDSNSNKMQTQFLSRKEEVVPVNDPNARPWPFSIDRHCIFMETETIPAGGYKVYKLVPKKTFERNVMFWAEMRKSIGENISREANILENENLKVTVQQNGAVSIFEKDTGVIYNNLNYFEDTGDCGDYWIYYPPYNNKTYTSLCCQAEICVLENGPLLATISARITMKLPAYALRTQNGVSDESRRSGEEKEFTITTFYTLKKGSKKLEVKTIIENTVEDHRFRAMFDTGIKAEFVDAAGHFTVDRRSVAPLKDSNGEFYPEMQTLPQQNFIDISDGNIGIALINNCLCEYEALDNKIGTVALTLFRSVRNIICTEFRSAGVFPEQKGGQALGNHEYEYSIYPHSGNWDRADVYTHAEQFNIPIKLAQTCRCEGGMLPLEHSFYAVEPSSFVMSSFKKCEDRESYIIRLFNPHNKEVAGSVTLYAEIREAYMTNLNEEREEIIPLKDKHTISVVAGSNKIITIEIIF